MQSKNILYLRQSKKIVIDVWIALSCRLTDSFSSLLSTFYESSTTSVNPLFIKNYFG